jgi:hypothetical protein
MRCEQLSCTRGQPSHPILSGDANAAPVTLSHLDGGRSLPEVESVQSLVFVLLVADVLPDHGFIPAHRGHHVPPRPEVLTNKVLLALSIDPGKVSRALALDAAHHL